jgi:hypothetical protein
VTRKSKFHPGLRRRGDSQSRQDHRRSWKAPLNARRNHLTPIELRLLGALAKRLGLVVTHRQLLITA